MSKRHHRRPRPRKKKKGSFEVPDFQKIFDQRLDSRWKFKTSRWDLKRSFQPLVPRGKGLSKQLGIRKGSRIHFFAGCYGDWASALAVENKVRYSDASREMVEMQRKYHPNIFESERVFDASQWPRNPKKYDWSVSFEPVPLNPPALALASMRSLLNNQGIKIICRARYPHAIIEAERVFNAVTSAYRCQMSISEAEIFDVKLRTKKKVKVLTLNTNSQARAMVGIDLQVLKAIRNSGANTVSELLETERVKRLGLSREGLIECLKRLEEIGKLEAKNFFLEYSGKSIKMK